MPVAERAARAHDTAVSMLETAAQKQRLSGMLIALAERKDELDATYTALEGELEAAVASPDPSAPTVTSDTKAAEFAKQVQANAKAEMEKARIIERTTAKMEQVGLAKDEVDARMKELLDELRALEQSRGRN